MTINKSSFKKIAVAAARAGDSKKAIPTVFDLAGKSPLADYAVLLVVEFAPQLDAVEEEVQVKLKQEGTYCLHRDGTRSKNWKVLDYGGVLVHVYDGKAAEFYAIDKVYDGCKTVEWEEAPVTKPAAPAVEKVTEEKPAEPKPAVTKPAVKKPAVKKAAEPKPAAKKAAVKKAAVKKPAAKKAAVKKAAAKKTAVKKPAAKKAPVKKAAKKTAPQKKASKPAKKAAAKKVKPARKAAKKTSKKK